MQPFFFEEQKIFIFIPEPKTMIMKRIVLAFMVCFIALGVMSQISFGPKLGLNLSKYTYDWAEDYNEPQVKFRLGGSIGGMMNLQINDWLAFQPSFSFTKKGTAHDSTRRKGAG